MLYKSLLKIVFKGDSKFDSPHEAVSSMLTDLRGVDFNIIWNGLVGFATDEVEKLKSYKDNNRVFIYTFSEGKDHSEYYVNLIKELSYVEKCELVKTVSSNSIFDGGDLSKLIK